MKKILSILSTSLISALVLSVFALTPSITFAQNYGNGNYGAGLYGIGATPTPAPNNNSNNSSGNNSSGNGNNGGGGCSAQQPTGVPDLFQIDAFMTSVTLYYSPYVQPYTGFQIVYGFKEGDNRYSTNISIQNSKGPVSTTINLLSPNTTYYFKVSGFNDCVGGAFSKSMFAKTGWVPFRKTSYYAYSQKTKTSQITKQPASGAKKTQPANQSATNQVAPPAPANNSNPNQPVPQVQNNTQPQSSQKNPPSQPQQKQKQTGIIESVVSWVKGLFGK